VVEATEADLASFAPPEPRYELARLRALFRTAFSHAPIGLAVVECEPERMSVVNEALCLIVRRTAEDLMGQAVTALIEPADRELDAELRERLVAGELSRYTTELRLRRADASHVWVRFTVAGDGQDPLSLIYQVEDITEAREAQSRLEHLVDHDPLTGLANRRRFDRELAREVERHARSGHGAGLLLLDLDGFKAINDELGHAAGDDVLRSLATAMAARTRATDILARLGGDEFAVLMPEATEESAAVLAEELVELVRAYRHGARRLTASVGVALIDGAAGSELLVRADAAMYDAKAAGGDRFAIRSSPTRSKPRFLRDAAPAPSLGHDGPPTPGR
jgi:diguanylate cyclase (GGDEF)-like protein/PAS domain S-box-containing protein